MRRDPSVVDRENEWARLLRAWESGRPELILVLGRRRVGKSRRTAALRMSPFSYLEAAAFMESFDARERLVAYGALGGLPGHLALLDGQRDLAWNVSDHMLDPAGRLADEAQHVLDAFRGEAEVHHSILQAIANGERTWSGIANRVGKESGSLSRPTRWLIEMELIERIVPITESRPQRSKRAIYRLADPYLAFWHTFVSPLISRGQLGLVEPSRLWREEIEPRLSDYMGPVFEEACRSFTWRSSALPFRPSRVGEWWSPASEGQLDVVALGGADDVIAGECKWGDVAWQDLTRLRRNADALLAELGGDRRVHLVLFSGRGTRDPRLASEIERGGVLHFTAEDLFAQG